jgi:hypothetical protein
VHRRTLLGLLGASIGVGAGLAGCTTSQDPADPTTGAPLPSPSEDTDAPLRTLVQADERALIGLYAQAIAAYPDLSDRLRPLADQHQQHFDALETAPENVDPDRAAESIAPPSLPANDAAAALAVLSNAERTAADQRTESCVGAVSSDLTRLLALIAASEASHSQVLAQGDTP